MALPGFGQSNVGWKVGWRVESARKPNTIHQRRNAHHAQICHQVLSRRERVCDFVGVGFGVDSGGHRPCCGTQRRNQSYSTPTFTGSGFGQFGAKLKSFVAGSSFIDQRAQQIVVSGATMVGGPIVAPSVAIPAPVPQSAPCEAPPAVAPPCEVRQQAACVMCIVCCQPCVIGNCVPGNGVILQPMPGVEHVPTPVPGTTPARPRLESPPGSAPVK